MKYCFDLDNTICRTDGKDYVSSTPLTEIINRINYLYDDGHEIIIFTARGMGKFNGNVKLVYEHYYEMTKSQLDNWNIKYHELILGKPSFDFFIDDKNFSIQEFKSRIKPKVGFIAGAFDLIHPGYIHMFETIKNNCDYLIVGLHENPNLQTKNKIDIVLSSEDRRYILSSIKYIDQVIDYKTEEDLYRILLTNKIDVRFLGEDYRGKIFTGSDLPIEINFNN